MIQRLFQRFADQPARAVLTLAVAYILSMVISVGVSVAYNNAQQERGRCLRDARDLEFTGLQTEAHAATDVFLAAIQGPLTGNRRAEVIEDYQAAIGAAEAKYQLAADIRATC